MPLPQLPSYIELRSPSPDPLPPTDVGDAQPSLESAFQRPGDRPIATRPSAVTSTIERHREEVTSEDEDDTETPAELDAFLRDLPLSDFLDHGRTLKFSPYVIEIDSFLVDVEQGESLGDFLDKLYGSRYPERRMNPLKMILNLLDDDEVSSSYFLETVIRRATENVGGILEWLDAYIDISTYGARALGTAAYRNHFEAVRELLRVGNRVDPNGSVSDPHPIQGCSCQMTVIDYAQLPRFDEQGLGASDEMIAYLLGQGAAKTTGVDKCLLGLLGCVLRHYEQYGDNLLANIQPIVGSIRGFPDIVSEMGPLLENYILRLDPVYTFFPEHRYRVIEYLLDQGAETNTSSPLAALILSLSLEEVIWMVLDKTANINAYCNLLGPGQNLSGYITGLVTDIGIQYVSPLSAAALHGKEKIVSALLRNGADVNCPARGSGGVTPLQAVCQLLKRRGQSQERKLRLLKLLLEHQANVNAAPAWNLGFTALQATAFVGDAEVADLLISRRADVNAPACKYGGRTALVVAARQGHADMVRLLLKAGASIPAAGVTVSSFGDTHDDHKTILDLLQISATELTALYGDNGVASRDYHEYEAEWADDPTYENKG